MFGINPLMMTPAGAPSMTWNPLDKDASITLSNGNLTAAGSANNSLVRATTRVIGKKYAELNMSIQSGNNTTIGLSKSSVSVSGTNLGFVADAIAYYASNQIYTNSSNMGSFDAYNQGDTVMMAFDNNTGNLWYGRNGVWLFGNPSAGTGGINIGTGDWYFTFNPSPSCTGVAKFGATPFSYTPPAGFI